MKDPYAWQIVKLRSQWRAVRAAKGWTRLGEVLRRFEGFIFALLLCSLQFCRGRNDPLRTAARPIGRARVKMAFHPTKEGPQPLCDLETWWSLPWKDMRSVVFGLGFQAVLYLLCRKSGSFWGCGAQCPQKSHEGCSIGRCVPATVSKNLTWLCRLL